MLGQPGSTAASASTVSRVGAGAKRRGGRPPRTQTGTPSGAGRRGGSKRARVDVEVLTAATSAEAAGYARPISVEEDYSSEPDDAAVKTEVRVLSKVDPRAKRRADLTEDERATAAEYCPGSEPDALVKAEMVVSLPSKRKTRGGQLKAIADALRNLIQA